MRIKINVFIQGGAVCAPSDHFCPNRGAAARAERKVTGVIRNALQRFMYGRYGNDQLNAVLIALSLALYVLFMAARWPVLYLVSWVMMLAALLRCLSRNYDRRRAENGKFQALVRPVVSWYRLRRTIRRDKEHCYFKCPNCGQQLRVPRGKGRITVTCRGCGASFEEKS